MTKENQKALYEHYKGIGDNSIKDSKGRDFKPIIRENARLHAEDIDQYYDFSGKKAKAAEDELKAKAKEKVEVDKKAKEAAKKAAKGA